MLHSKNAPFGDLAAKPQDFRMIRHILRSERKRKRSRLGDPVATRKYVLAPKSCAFRVIKMQGASQNTRRFCFVFLTVKHRAAYKDLILSTGDFFDTWLTGMIAARKDTANDIPKISAILIIP